MQKIYWRPQRVSTRLLTLLALISVGGIASLETFRVRERQPHYKQKIAASRLAKRAFEALKDERLKRNIAIDPETDPSESGLIGELLTPVTTNPGYLPAKYTSVNPNFAALVLHYLLRAGVEPGDRVALGLTGSFPAVNVAVLAAVETLKLRPVIISSAGASQWGANHADFMWPEMERVLHARRIFSHRSVAISRGGIDDRALGLTKPGRILLDAAVERGRVPMLKVRNYVESVERRWELYTEHADDEEIKAYVNVGGGTSSVGTHAGKRMFRPGLNRSAPRGSSPIDSVMTRFARDGVPVINLRRIDDLAKRYDFPLQPDTMPPVGQGRIFERETRSVLLAAGLLALIVLMLFAFVRLDWGYRLLESGRKAPPASGRPEPMV